MDRKSNMLKVLSPVEGKNGKTYWMRVGSAFLNRDGSTNVYLNAYPTSGKLQIRPFDAQDGHSGGQHAASSGRQHDYAGEPVGYAAGQEDLPF